MLRFRREKQVHGSWVCSFLAVFLVVVVLSSSIQFGQCQLNGLAGSPSLSPDVSSLATQLLYDQLSNPTRTLNDQINQHFGYCVADSEDDWNRSFNFSSNLGFVDACEAKINGNFSNRVCTTAEIKYYFGGLLDRTGRPSISEYSKNCNLTSWSSGCEPGWACSIGSGAIDLQNSSIIPSRTSNCQPCCEGFYCPSGLACMIPCPLGSYCPLATLNTSTGVCEPYTYQLPPGNPNHTCGGANIWADYGSSKEMFCSGGSYCPTTIQENNCSSGHYCRAGSTSEARCLSLTTCKANNASQSLELYGAIVIVILIIILIVIYNCSDQVLTIRERRLAKAREKAANMAKEKVRAREKWQMAKVAAKKYARDVQNQFSQKFSRKINFREYEETEELEMLSEIKVETDDHFYSPAHPSTSHPSEESSVSSKGKEKEDSSKGRHKHNRTVIFANTYAQLEKEKALQVENKNLTFSGVISMATDTDVKRRPPIELEFNNLTLTLKGKKKHLLRCVTGNIKPGRITAVMGPSGAGKTTFLTALLGKSIGCTITGSILINGKHDSNHAYKKIIGFVPQDDIVHGNLTVEENLWFSANCRLPANIARADKVLIIERVIEYLGLHGIRDSLVGTEKRGISGGQRKRVNVGLEMVIEPSLLILDEPTSGLDSSTSQLLLRALKREAHEGVNVCMVIHQPSYALFSMFDDLVLLAKGGFTAYLGPVKEVESYFAGLGITVPERINPPDHFIDVLEGVVKPTASGTCSHNELPVRWMLHNRYVVPNDLRESVPGPIMSSTPASPAPETDHLDNEMVEHSFVRELCQDVKSKMALRKEKIMRNFKKTEDISRRRTPGVLQQYRYFLGRVGKQRLREARVQAMDYLILFLAGTCLGILAKANDESFGVLGYTNTVIAIPLLCQIAALRTFSLEKLQYWRESSSGISSLAYFLAKDTIDHFNTVVKPLVYLSMFYFFSNPRSSFTENYIVLLCLVYCVTGVAYALSIFLHPGSAQLTSVLLPVIMTLIATQTGQSGILKFIANLCYTKWALQAFVIANAKRYFGVWLITRCAALRKYNYSLKDGSLCILILVLVGVGTRVLAFMGMLSSRKK